MTLNPQTSAFIRSIKIHQSTKIWIHCCQHAAKICSTYNMIMCAIWQGALPCRGNNVLVGTTYQIHIHVNTWTQSFLSTLDSLCQLMFFTQWLLVPSLLGAIVALLWIGLRRIAFGAPSPSGWPLMDTHHCWLGASHKPRNFGDSLTWLIGLNNLAHD